MQIMIKTFAHLQTNVVQPIWLFCPSCFKILKTSVVQFIFLLRLNQYQRFCKYENEFCSPHLVSDTDTFINFDLEFSTISLFLYANEEKMFFSLLDFFVIDKISLTDIA